MFMHMYVCTYCKHMCIFKYFNVYVCVMCMSLYVNIVDVCMYSILILGAWVCVFEICVCICICSIRICVCI